MLSLKYWRRKLQSTFEEWPTGFWRKSSESGEWRVREFEEAKDDEPREAGDVKKILAQ